MSFALIVFSLVWSIADSELFDDKNHGLQKPEDVGPGT